MLCGLRAGWGRRRAADAAGPGPRSLGGEPRAGAGGAGARCGGGWDAPAGRLWGQIASRGEAAEWGPARRLPGSAMAAQRDPLSGYLPQPLSDPGSNSERSADSPAPGSEEDSAGPPRPLHSPEWGEERFRVDRKKLEAMLQGEGGSGGGARGARGGGGGRRERREGPRSPPCRVPAPPSPPERESRPVSRFPGRWTRAWVGGSPVGRSLSGRCRGLSGRGSGSLWPRSRAERPGPSPDSQMPLGAGRPRRRGCCRCPAPLGLGGSWSLGVPSVGEKETSRPGRRCGLSAFEEQPGAQGAAGARRPGRSSGDGSAGLTAAVGPARPLAPLSGVFLKVFFFL